MNFKYSVIGDNTAENREWLEKLGYELTETAFKRELLVTGYPNNNSAFGVYHYNAPWLNSYGNYIDCRSNPPLFQAVTAIREDSDYLQLFSCGEDNDSLFLCKYDNVKDHIHNKMDGWDVSNCRKMDLEELQEDFKI